MRAAYAHAQGHDVVESRELGDNPGDQALLERGAAEQRILVTLDGDFGELIYVREATHAGLVRLPDVPAKQRIALMAEVIERHRQALDMGDEEVRDEMFTMLVAGHETTATLVA